ncbi:hypothetical protein GCM10010124_08990 [Pilimelia terevasa]|uniref:Uncharacterized protein n=1 Tax=Pilimelia terevasa TaxID=53372 RepID=A0A8J3BJ63_9ACTN|nr:hypothetical protein GCM10010124_08990 [Pilimelia terevasa]
MVMVLVGLVVVALKALAVEFQTSVAAAIRPTNATARVRVPSVVIRRGARGALSLVPAAMPPTSFAILASVQLRRLNRSAAGRRT